MGCKHDVCRFHMCSTCSAYWSPELEPQLREEDEYADAEEPFSVVAVSSRPVSLQFAGIVFCLLLTFSAELGVAGGYIRSGETR